MRVSGFPLSIARLQVEGDGRPLAAGRVYHIGRLKHTRAFGDPLQPEAAIALDPRGPLRVEAAPVVLDRDRHVAPLSADPDPRPARAGVLHDVVEALLDDAIDVDLG